MSKYVCCSCGNVFDEDEIAYWTEYHGQPEYMGEHWCGSPCCHGHFVEAHECEYCGEIITTEQYVEIDDKKYCWDCVSIKDLEDM